jgi:hypothetical protein
MESGSLIEALPLQHKLKPSDDIAQALDLDFIPYSVDSPPDEKA